MASDRQLLAESYKLLGDLWKAGGPRSGGEQYPNMSNIGELYVRLGSHLNPPPPITFVTRRSEGGDRLEGLVSFATPRALGETYKPSRDRLDVLMRKLMLTFQPIDPKQTHRHNAEKLLQIEAYLGVSDTKGLQFGARLRRVEALVQ